MSTLKEELFEKKSFIYQIGGDYYAIGSNTFAKLTGSPELDNLELFRNALKKNNERQIVKYYEKILRIANTYRADAREHYKLRDRLYAFLDELEKNDEAAFRELQSQIALADELTKKYLPENT
ncbi:MAG: hypothetical protein LUE96_09920 [Lachnospiraceae bacterium]|nr:hypothetical protein [Lachnospiraceae bacterium]